METGFHEPLRHPDPAFPVIFHPNALEGAGRVEAHWHEGIEVLCCFQGAAAVRSGGEQLLIQMSGSPGWADKIPYPRDLIAIFAQYLLRESGQNS